MTDYQIGLAAGGGTVAYNTIDALDLKDCTVYYSGWLATVPHLIVDVGCVFYWG
jgi:hypothetical protein